MAWASLLVPVIAPTVATLTTGVALYVEATVLADRCYVVDETSPVLVYAERFDTFAAGGGGALAATGTAGGTAGGRYRAALACCYFRRASATPQLDKMVSIPTAALF